MSAAHYHSGLDPAAIPAIFAMALLFVNAPIWWMTGHSWWTSAAWIASMSIPYLLLRWGRT